MSKLIHLVREYRHGSSGDDFLVVHITNFFTATVPISRIGGPKGAVLEPAANETFQIFEARVIAAAKTAGHRFVAIEVPASYTGDPIQWHRRWHRRPRARGLHPNS
jgi:hypothetical protein